jgi:hypothetical protein
MIRKSGKKWCLYSKSTDKEGKRRNLGCYSSKKGAESREKQVNMFKHMKEHQISMTSHKLTKIIEEEITAAEMKPFFDKLGKQLGSLDKSIDFLASALTGMDPLDIEIAQSTYGRLATPQRRKNAIEIKETAKMKLTPEQLRQMVIEEIEDSLEEDKSFSKAGEEIEKKGTEGVFTAKAKKAGMGVQAYADKVLQKGSKASTKTKRQAAFAKGAATVARENK